MAGLLLNLIPKRVFDFGALQNGSSQSLVIAEQINILQYCDGVLIIRVHNASLTAGQIVMELLPDGHTDDDSLIFVGSQGYFSAPIVLDSSTQAGSMVAIGSVNGALGGQYAMLVVTGIKMSASSNLAATLSVDLLLRSPEDVDGIVARAVSSAGGCGCEEP